MNKNCVFNQVKRSVDIISTVRNLLPNGKRENQEYVALNPTRADQHLGSFRINLNSGKWIDYATTDKGGDITSLYAYIKGISQYEAAQYLLGNYTYSRNCNFSNNPPKSSKINVEEYINKLWDESLDPKNSIIENYLNHRGLLLQNIPRSIRYHPNLYHKHSGKSFPVMLSAVTKYGSDKIVALHRTYLKVDGGDKADITPNKMMLGQVKGTAVMLTPTGSKLVIVEGIETALSIYAATGFSTWASLSAWGMLSIQVPPVDITQEITIAADADKTGIASANKLAVRLLDEGYKVSIAIPEQGTDFNDALMEIK